VPITIGSRLGPYEILAAAGAGGMGEVYRARDTRLDRIVAIKVLPEHVAADPQFRDRFDREARAISALAHPHICTLFDVGEQDGTAYLVMQYLEGETLADRLSGGALPIEQAIQVAMQVADALATAHTAGIVHRDLKPGNIMLTKAGAKLMDFGLAKTGAGAAAGAHLSMAPTTPPLTQMGAILGTVQYMAPEQVEGDDADARSDIFAFGSVVYEMLTGKKAFAGRSQASVMAAILNLDPAPMLPLVPLAPPELDHVVTRCLAKDPDERWQSARDVLHELRWAAEERPAGAPASARAPRPRSPFQLAAWPLAILFLIAAVAIGGVHWFGPKQVPRAVWFEVSPPKGVQFASGTRGARMAISPDGTLLAYAASEAAGQPNQIWVRRLDALNSSVLAGTEGVDTMFWSPDSRSIGFFADQKLKKIDVAGGTPQTLCRVPGPVMSGTWNRDGVILFSSANTGGIRRVSAEGGEPAQLTAVDDAQGRHYWPRFLQDGRHFLFFNPDVAPGKHGTYVGLLDSKDVRRIVKSDSIAEVVPPHDLVFIRETALFTQAFEQSSLEVRGDAVRVVENVSVDLSNGRAGFSVAGEGVLVFAPGSGVSAGSDLEFRVFDRTGKELGRVGGPFAYRGLDLSPDGKHIAAHRHEDRGGDIWITDSDRGNNSRLTFDPSQHNASPIWSPDGQYIAFGSIRNGSWGIYRKSSSGVGAEELLFESKSQILPMDWSRDGQTIVFWLNNSGSTSGDIWRLPLQGDRKPVPFLQTPAAEQHAQLSPDGRWLTYTSTESGRSEVYVQSFPSTGTKYQLSTDGALFPRWRHDGKEILFMGVTLSGNGRIMSVTVQPSGEGLKFSAPQLLFDSRYVNWAHTETGGGIYHTFAVSPDGQRFVVPVQRNGAGDAPAPLTVVMNWMSAVRR
jgi:eukaryotic-like serine/threonine-protein kinase